MQFAGRCRRCCREWEQKLPFAALVMSSSGGGRGPPSGGCRLRKTVPLQLPFLALLATRGKQAVTSSQFANFFSSSSKDCCNESLAAAAVVALHTSGVKGTVSSHGLSTILSELPDKLSQELYGEEDGDLRSFTERKRD